MNTGTNHIDVADRALALAASARRGPDFETVRQVLNDVGIGRSRRVLAEAPDLVANARLTLADAKEAEKVAKDAYLQVVTEAEWLGSAVFVSRANKVWLTVADDGTPIAEADQQSMPADERRAYIADRAAKTPEVRTAMVAYSAAERRRAAAADEVAVAEMRFSAARHDVDAAAAEMQFWGLWLRTLPTNQET